MLMNYYRSYRALQRPVFHLLGRLLKIAIAYAFLSRLGQVCWRYWIKLHDSKGVSGPKLRVALYAHVFYPELIDEILVCYRTLPDHSDLYITTPPELQQQVVSNSPPHANIVITPNRGRDIGPFISLLQSGAFDAYDVILKLHTKKSPHLLTGSLRRRLLYSQLTGTSLNVKRILRLFADGQIGLVGSGSSFRSKSSYWMANKQRVHDLIESIAPSVQVEPAFFEGSMFWFRPAALHTLGDLHLSSSDFPEEAGELDGTLHHALERCFVLAAASRGFTTYATDGRRLYPK